MTDRLALFGALQRSDLEAFANTFAHFGRGPASRHALRIDGTRYAAGRVVADDHGHSGLALIGFTSGLLLADRLSGPLAPFTRAASALLASSQAFWCLRGPLPDPELPEMLFIGDLPQEVPALTHALFTLVHGGDAIQAAEVVDRLLARGFERDRLVGILARVLTERSSLSRPLLLLSTALQLSARLGGDEVGNLLRAVVRGAIAAQHRPPSAGLPPRATLSPDIDQEVAGLLASQVGAGGVADLRRVRARVRQGGDAAWRAILESTQAKVSWLPLIDMLSLVCAERLMRVQPDGPAGRAGLEAVSETLSQVRAVRWLMGQHPSPGAFKGLFEVAAQVGWLSFLDAPAEEVLAVSDQNPARLLQGLRDAFKAGDRAAASGYVGRYRELNLPREALAGALVEEAVRGGRDVEDTCMRLAVTEAALAEAEALYGSMEEGSYYQGLARVLTMVPADTGLARAIEARG